MKRMFLAFLLVALSIATNATASPQAPVPLRDLYQQASVVAVVEVLEGQVVAAGGEACGARYRGRVIEGTKNATAGQVVDFGFLLSLKVGTKYLVLLEDYKNVQLAQYPDFQSRCERVLPDLALVGLGRGAMEVTSSVGDPMNRASWTVRKVPFVVYPLGTRSSLVDGERQLVFTDMVDRMTDGGAEAR